MTTARHKLSFAVLASLAGCSSGPEKGPDASLADAGVDIGPPVADLVSVGCSTEVVYGLSLQIADEVACMDPQALTEFSEGAGIVFNSAAVLPYLSPTGLSDLQDALGDNGGQILINSGFRTVVQQYLLYRWFQDGLCGITAAATPGRSNHESGRALDIGNYQEWSGILPAYGWEQTVLPADPVHYDHLLSPDNRGRDVLAFQRLWNRNRPGDLIDEDGIYGSMTELRIEDSPSGGFALGPQCRSRAARPAGGPQPSDAARQRRAPLCAH